MATLLLIHGGLWEDTSADWFWGRPGVSTGLERLGFTVVAPDRLRRAPSWADEAAYVASAVRGAVSAALPAGPVTVIGGSFGCAVAARLALEFPALTGRLLLAWPAALSDQFLATRFRAQPGQLGTETLPSVPDEELCAITIPVGVIPSVPPNPLHSRGTVDALLRLLPDVTELPGCPEAPRPEFADHLDAFLDAVAGFVGP